MTTEELIFVKLHIPLQGADGRRYSPTAIREVEALLLQRFGGFSAGTAEGALHDVATGQTFRDVHRTYELAAPRWRHDEVIKCARKIAAILHEYEIFLTINNTAYVVGPGGPRRGDVALAEVSTKPAGWAAEFDIAIQVVISPELEAVQSHFKVDQRKDILGLGGDIYYRGSCATRSGQHSVVIYCQGHAGNDAAAVAAERLILRWHPKVIFLLGIAAGYRDKCKIGDVVTPSVVVNDQLGVMRLRRRLKRTQIYTPPQMMVQLLQNCPVDEAVWYKRLLDVVSPPRAPRGRSAQYRKHVARKPRHHVSAIYSSNLLLRDPNVLQRHQKHTHEQIRVGEMEAAGFSYACQTRFPPLPWFVVRGVSDFGDDFKDDVFHKWASHSAAAYLRCLLKGFDLDLLRSLQEGDLKVKL